jgi:uncharacterized protein YraI
MRKLLLIIFQLLLSFVLQGQLFKYTSTNLNLRSGPGTSYTILATIPASTSVEMEEDCTCTWIKVSYQGTIGYVSSKYLTNNKDSKNVSSKGKGYKGNSSSSGGYYTNSDGERVPSPRYSEKIPAGATALCRDGTYSFSRNRKGTCSHHGGVARWIR